MKSRISSSSGPEGDIRIIGGQWRRTRLSVPVRPGLRPTPDRVRETLFNWLGQSLEGWRCVDVFAGTGALGLEAASRGATQVVLCEQDRGLVQRLQQNLVRLQAAHVQVVSGDGLNWLRQASQAATDPKWDLIFLDPPFDANLFDAALQAATAAIAAQGLIYLEAPTPWDDARLTPLGLAVHRHLKAGAVHAHLLKRVDQTETA